MLSCGAMVLVAGVGSAKAVEANVRLPATSAPSMRCLVMMSSLGLNREDFAPASGLVTVWPGAFGDVTFRRNQTNVKSGLPSGGSGTEGADGTVAGRRWRGLCRAVAPAHRLSARVLPAPLAQSRGCRGFAARDFDRDAYPPFDL